MTEQAVLDRMAKARAARTAKRAERNGHKAEASDPMKELETLKLKIDNHLTEHRLKEEALKPKPWIYRCSVRGCGETFELPSPENRIGVPAPLCPKHGQVELHPVSTPVAGYGSGG